ncbi:SRPBCC domain-containing protein [Actinotalea sp. K2]|uniref:SRPBCC domain-containing protein n=1 Tax=Actinotalea sp. K2 TaxID=2939438 RepID=UPI002017093E|nr:SRPBCC domain-containing protein [Actinotalea sp. K2]MCL3859405.1 SRPBCC domain-containing protein [Actinotalea sp. K2]
MTTPQIETEILIDAPVEKVWQVVTQADHLGTWFADDGAEIDLRVGGTLTLRWREHGTYRARIDVVEPNRCFAFRWTTSPDTEIAPGNHTRVELTLTPQGDGTRLSVVESGFDTLARSEADQLAARQENVEGWAHELGELRDHLARIGGATGTA